MTCVICNPWKRAFTLTPMSPFTMFSPTFIIKNVLKYIIKHVIFQYYVIYRKITIKYIEQGNFFLILYPTYKYSQLGPKSKVKEKSWVQVNFDLSCNFSCIFATFQVPSYIVFKFYLGLCYYLAFIHCGTFQKA